MRRSEQLEDRTLLSVSVLASDSFTIPPGGTSDLTLTVPDTNGSAPTVFGVKVERDTSIGSTLDPSAMTVMDRSTGNPIAVMSSRRDADSRHSSIILVELPPGEYTIRVGGDRGTSGGAIGTVFLPGDVGNSGGVTPRDGQQARLANMQQTTGVTFVGSLLFQQLGFNPNIDQSDAALDVDQDGDIDMFDVGVIERNINAPRITLGANGLATGLTLVGDEDPPAVTVVADTDTGRSSTDRVTNVLSLSVTITDVSLITSFEGSVDSGAFVDFSSSIETNGGTFALSEAALDGLLGSAVRNTGSHTLNLQATDEIGNETGILSFTFELDTMAPDAPTGLDLIAASDAGTLDDDNITNDNTPTIVGDAEDNAIVDLTSSVTANVVGTGTANSPFSITTSALPDGMHNFTATAEDVAGNVSSPSTGLAVTIDTVAPAIPVFDLEDASDTGTDGDQLTETTPVNFVGTTEGMAAVTLTNTGAMTTADGGGAFGFNAVALPFVVGGGTEFTVNSTDTAGNVATFSRTFVRNVAPDAVNDVTFTTDEDNSLIQSAVAGVLANDTDPNVGEGDMLTVTEVNGMAANVGTQITLAGTGALLRVNADGGFTYDPNGRFESLAAGESDTDTFTYTITDTNGGTDTATVTLTITGVNDTPDAVNDSDGLFTTDEDNSLMLDAATGVLANDTDVDTTDVLMVSEVNGVAAAVGMQITLGTGALLTVEADGEFTYDPNGSFESLAAGESTTDSFTYTISDGNGGADTATVTLTINGVNDTPDAVNDSGALFTIDEDNSLTQSAEMGVLDNDTDVDASDMLTVSAVEGMTGAVNNQITLGGSGALLTVNDNGSFTYDPNGMFESLAVGESGTDTFTYTISDGNGGSDTATVTLTITGVNDTPDAVDDLAFTTDEDSILMPAAPGVLANDTDVDASDMLMVSAVNGEATDVDNQVTLDSGALLTVNDDGGFAYDPNASFESLAEGAMTTDSFTYTADDGNGGTDSATVTLTITGENDAPVAMDDMLNALNQAVVTSLNVLLNDTDVDDGDELFVDSVVITSADRGSVVAPSSDGKRIEYQPGGSLIGTTGMTETFTYTIRDRLTGGLTDTATLTVTVVANQAPVAAAFDAGSTNEDTSLNVLVAGLIAAATDPETDPIMFNSFVATSVNGASITLSGDMTTLIFNPSGAAALQALSVGDTSIVDTFTYTLTDGTSVSDPATISVTVTPVNDTPDAVNDSGALFTTDEDNILTLAAAQGVLANDTDVDANDMLTVSEVDGVTRVDTPIMLDSGALLTVDANGGFTYDPNGGFEDLAAGMDGTDTFTYTASDGNGGTDTATVTLTITAVNDAPVVVLPTGPVTATEDTPLDLTNVAISISDVDDQGADLTATVTVDEGTLTITSGNSGVGVTGSGGMSVTLVGTGAELQTLLRGTTTGTVTYSAIDDPATSTVFTVSVSDGVASGADPGSTGTGGDEVGLDSLTINITAVNDAPVVVLPGDATPLPENTPLDLTDPGFSVSDVDDRGADLTAIVSVGEGTITVDPGTIDVDVTNSGSSSVTLVGTAAELQALGRGQMGATLVYETTDDPSTSTDLTVAVSDGGATGTDPGSSGGGNDEVGSATVTINITPINDAPTVAVPAGPVSATEGTPLDLTNVAFSVADVDAQGNDLIATLAVLEGTLTVTPGTSDVAVSNSGTMSVTLTGTAAELQALLRGNTDGTVTYSAVDDPAASTSLTLTVNDGGASGDDPGSSGGVNDEEAFALLTINITAVNDPPVVVLPQDATPLPENTTLDLRDAAFSVSDVDAQGADLTATLTVTEGTLTVNAGDSMVDVTTNSPQSVTLVGTAAELQALGRAQTSGTIDYDTTDNPSAVATLTLTVDDGGATGTDPGVEGNGGTAGTGSEAGTDSATINITPINDAPTVAVPAGPLSATEDTPQDVTNGAFSISDVDDQGNDLTATLEVEEGTLTVTPGTSDVTVSNSGSASVTLTGTAAELQAFLRGTTDGTATYSAIDDPAASAQLTLTVNDGGASGADPGSSGGDNDEEASALLTINITPVNDAPTVAAAIVDRTQADGDNDTVIPLSGVFSDPENDALTFTVVSSNEDLVLATIEGNSDLRLSYPVYTAAGDRTPATITLTATETSTTETLSVADAFTVTVTPQNTIEFFLVVTDQDNADSFTSPPRRASLEDSITTVTAGDFFFVEVWFRDLFSPGTNQTSIPDSDTSTGVAGLAANVIYDGDLADAVFVDISSFRPDFQGNPRGASAFGTSISSSTSNDFSDDGVVRNFSNGGFSTSGGLGNVGVDEFARAGIIRLLADDTTTGSQTISLNLDLDVASENGGSLLSPARAAGEQSASGEINLSQVSLGDAVTSVGASVTITHVTSGGGGQLGTQVGADASSGSGATITTTVVREPTPLEADGTVSDVPPSADWVHEWDSYWVEVWGSATSGSLDAAQFNLNYNNDYFTATSVEFGVANSDAAGEFTIDDATGVVGGFSGVIHGDAVSDAQVLLGRVRFESIGDDQVPIGDSGTPYDLGIDISDVTFTVDSASVVPQLDNQAQNTELWPVVYDFDDSGTIGYADLSILANALSTTVADSDSESTWFSDLDRSGIVSFGDVTLFSENFGLTRSTAGELKFPTGFQRRWSGSEIISDGQNSLTTVFDAALADWNAAVDVDLPEIQLVVEDLPGAELGHGSIVSVGADGLPDVGRVVIDSDAAGLGWYTGLDGESVDGLVDTSRYDLLTVLTHEIGHAIGFSSAFAGYTDSVQTEPDGTSVFVTSIGDSIALDQSAEHLDSDVYPNDLMVAFISPGIRRSISVVDVQVIESAYAAASAGDELQDAVDVHLYGQDSVEDVDDELLDAAFGEWEQLD